MKQSTLLSTIGALAIGLTGIALATASRSHRQPQPQQEAASAPIAQPQPLPLSDDLPTECGDRPKDEDLEAAVPWASARFTGADGHPYRLQLLARNWKEFGCNPNQGVISAVVYRAFGDRARVASVDRIFEAGRYGWAPSPHDNEVRITQLGNTDAGTSYLAVNYSWWEGHGDDIHARSAVILSVRATARAGTSIGYHGEVETALEGCTFERATGRATRAKLYTMDWDCDDRRPFGYKGVLQLIGLSDGAPALAVYVARGDTDRDAKEFKRIPARDRQFKQDERGMYQRVR